MLVRSLRGMVVAMTRRSKRPDVGAVVEVPLGDGRRCFGLVLPSPRVAFFDLCASSDLKLEVEEIRSRPVLFQLLVMQRPLSMAEWPVIGEVPVEPALLEGPYFFREDPISGKLSISKDGVERIPATLAEVAGLERAAVWDAEHVVDRLKDHFAGRPCRWIRPVGRSMGSRA